MNEDDYTELDRVTLFKAIGDNGELLTGYTISEGMTFIEVVGLMEACKLSMNEMFRNGEWDEAYGDGDDF